MFGASKDYEAKYLMDEDVVLVTVAYRLGAFGFLNTEGGGSDVQGKLLIFMAICAYDIIHDKNGECVAISETLVFRQHGSQRSIACPSVDSGKYRCFQWRKEFCNYYGRKW